MEELKKRLNRVGKGSFVEDFPLYQSYANNQITRDKALKTLMKEYGYMESGASIRLGYAKQIFNEGLECPALKIVAQANPDRLRGNGHNIIATAQELIKKHC